MPDLFFTGNSAKNKLYFNKGNFKFEDVTEEAVITGEFWSTGVSMADVNNDGWLDIYVCHSGPLWYSSVRNNQLFINQRNGQFIDETRHRGVDNNGYSVQSSFFDYDRDGDLDLFVMTHMSSFRPEKYLIINDLRQMSPEKFETYASFANASLDDIYTKKKLRNALHYEAYTFSSIYLENKGDFEFVIHKLPSAAQFGPINGIVIKDFDEGGSLEAVVAGGMLGAEVETPSYDANVGLFLKSIAVNEFESHVTGLETGIFLNRNVKDLASINIGAQKIPAILVANNNNPVQIVLYQ